MGGILERMNLPSPPPQFPGTRVFLFNSRLEAMGKAESFCLIPTGDPAGASLCGAQGTMRAEP